MNQFILILAAVLALASAQYSGGSAGGLLGDYKKLDHIVFGLSRGIEIGKGKEESKGYEYEGHGGHYESGGEGGQGEQGEQGEQGKKEESEGQGKKEESEGQGEEKKEESIGNTGTDFKTPVDTKHEEIIHIKAYPEYHYDYHVADKKHNDFKSQHEVREGNKVKGSYSLLEPDHKTIRVVDYESDKKQGFIAKVSYKKH